MHSLLFLQSVYTVYTLTPIHSTCNIEEHSSLPDIMTGTISVEILSGAVSVCGGSMVGVGDGKVSKGIIDLVLARTLDGVAQVGQSV